MNGWYIAWKSVNSSVCVNHSGRQVLFKISSEIISAGERGIQVEVNSIQYYQKHTLTAVSDGLVLQILTHRKAVASLTPTH